MKTRLQMRYRLRVCDAKTNKIKREIRGGNTVLDAGLTGLANHIGTAGLFTNLCVGSSAAANYIPGGAVTFTQALTTITASAPFFTAPMVGGIFKFGHGTGGLEAYIQSIGGGGTTAVVDISRAVVVPDAGTVWLVQQTHLTTFSYNYDAYAAGATNNSTTPNLAGGICTVTQKRTFVFNQKVAPYTIKELGWGHTGGANPPICGRVVLVAPEVIGVNDYVICAVELICTFAPTSPVVSAAGDQIWDQYKGTGIYAGEFALEVWDTQTIAASGAVAGGGVLDGSCGGYLYVLTNAAFAQNANIGANPPNPATATGYSATGIPPNWAQVGGQYPGVSQLTWNFTFNTAGEILYGIGLLNGSGNDIMLDMIPGWSGGAPSALPTGAFPVQTLWQNVWTRPLDNP